MKKNHVKVIIGQPRCFIEYVLGKWGDVSKEVIDLFLPVTQ